MHVRLDAADLVNIDARGIHAMAAEVMMDDGFNLRREERRAILGVPDDMEVDLGVIVSGHGKSPYLKVNNEKPRERTGSSLLARIYPMVVFMVVFPSFG